jgi:hypothetical protein
MTNEDKQNLGATILGFIILTGIFYVIILGINTIGVGLREIALAIMSSK